MSERLTAEELAHRLHDLGIACEVHGSSRLPPSVVHDEHARRLLATLDAAPDDLRRLSEAATPGPWYWEPGDGLISCRVGSEGHRRGVGDFTLFGMEPKMSRDPWDRTDAAYPEADAAFIVAAVNYVRSLFAEPVRSQAEDGTDG